MPEVKVRGPVREQDKEPSFSRGSQVSGDSAADLLPCNLYYEDGRCVMAAYKNVSIVAWATQATLPLVERLESLGAHMASSYLEGHSTVHIILRDTPPPDAEARAKLLSLTQENAHKLACNVAVIDSGGFWASAMRGLITSFHWLKSRRFKSRTCATIEEVAAWLPAPHLEMTSVPLEQAELLAVLRSIRQRVGG
jgi:hypothetical protein